MDQINFSSDRMVIVCFAPFAGGKFLINSLGLSTGAVFQDAVLAQQDLAGQLSSADKFTILKTRLQQVPDDHWNDLNFGDRELFGPDYKNPIVPRLSRGQKYFFSVAHNYDVFCKIYQYWPRAKLIIFKNSHEFIEHRLQLKRNYHWQLIRAEQWPLTPPNNTDEFKQLDPVIQEEINKRFIGFADLIKLTPERFNDSIEKVDAQGIYHWDNRLYFNPLATVDNIKQLYQWLDLPDFNKEFVSEYHGLWASELTRQK